MKMKLKFLIAPFLVTSLAFGAQQARLKFLIQSMCGDDTRRLTELENLLATGSRYPCPDIRFMPRMKKENKQQKQIEELADADRPVQLSQPNLRAMNRGVKNNARKSGRTLYGAANNRKQAK
jgi:hypothetical protein